MDLLSSSSIILTVPSYGGEAGAQFADEAFCEVVNLQNVLILVCGHKL